MTDESLIYETDRESSVVKREMKLLSVNYILGHVTLFHQYFHPASFIRKQIKSLMIGCSFNEVQVSRNNYIQNLFQLSTLKLYLNFSLYKRSEITVQNISLLFHEESYSIQYLQSVSEYHLSTLCPVYSQQIFILFILQSQFISDDLLNCNVYFLD